MTLSKPHLQRRTGLVPSFFLIIISLFLSVSVFADVSYKTVGTENYDFMLGSTLFGESMDDYNDNTRVISSPQQTPFVADLDGDGVKEIIALDGLTIKVYHGKGLIPMDSFTLAGQVYPMSNILIYDIDADSKKEIIIASASKILNIIQYTNDTAGLTSEYSGSWAAAMGQYDSGELLIGCRDTDDCLLVATTYDERQAGIDAKIYALAFNSAGNQTTGSYLIDTAAGGSSFFCFPTVPVLAVADVDEDEFDDYTLSYVDSDITANDYIEVSVINVSNTKYDAVRVVNQPDVDHFGMDTVQSCDAGLYRNYFTAPLVMDTTTEYPGLEMVIGAAKDADEFKIHVLSSVSTEVGSFPELADGDGIMLSNPFKSQVLRGEAGQHDEFCVVGYADRNAFDNCETCASLSIVCASMLDCEPNTPLTCLSSRTFWVDIRNLDNLTAQSFSQIAHSIDADDTRYNSFDPLEVLTSYGVIRLDKSDCSELLGVDYGACDGEIIWSNPKGEAALISADAQNNGEEDILGLTSTNLWYFDDKFTNSPAYIQSGYIDPCTDSGAWKNGTSVAVRVVVNDPEEDSVSARVILYANETFNQTSGWEAYGTPGSSGVSYNFLLTANRTISTGYLYIETRDTGNGTGESRFETFTVSTSGSIELGDCRTELIQIYDEDGEDGNVTALGDDALTTTITDLDELLGLGLGTTVIWLIIMAVVGGVLFVNGRNNLSVTGGIVMIIEIVLTVIGLKLGFLPLGLIVTLAILSLAVLAFRYRDLFLGGVGGARNG